MWVVPKDSRIKPHWRTVRKVDEQDKHKRNYHSRLCDVIGKNHYDKLKDIVHNSKCDSAKVWDKYSDDFHVVLAPRGGDCCYIPSTWRNPQGRIYCNMEDVAEGVPCQTSYQAFYHESGHYIDAENSIEEDMGYALVEKTYSVAYKNGALVKALQEDIKNLFNSYDKTGNLYAVMNREHELTQEFWGLANSGKLNADWLIKQGVIHERLKEKYDNHIKDIMNRCDEEEGFTSDDREELEEWLYDITCEVPAKEYDVNTAYDALDKLYEDFRAKDEQEVGDFSDMLEGATQCFVILGPGHGKDYWDSDNTKLATETFAEMMSAEIANPKSLNCIKEYLPNTYKVYQEMIHDLSKKKRRKKK